MGKTFNLLVYLLRKNQKKTLALTKCNNEVHEKINTPISLSGHDEKRKVCLNILVCNTAVLLLDAGESKNINAIESKILFEQLTDKRINCSKA